MKTDSFNFATAVDEFRRIRSALLTTMIVSALLFVAVLLAAWL